jgi:uncharacterized protein (DUF3820 family)
MHQQSWTGSERQRKPQQSVDCPNDFRGNRRYVTAAECEAMPFGRYRGKTLGTIPADYLRWVLEKTDGREELKRLIRDVLSLKREQPHE